MNPDHQTLSEPSDAFPTGDPWADLATAATFPAELAQTISGDAEHLVGLADVLDQALDDAEPARQLGADLLTALVMLSITCANAAAIADLSSPPTREAISALRSLESAACGVLAAAGVLTTGLEQAPSGAAAGEGVRELRARAAGIVRQAHGHVMAAATALDPALPQPAGPYCRL
ncbi:hypothetical protein [Kitasatospora sp. GAS1066B]|uniref:hypothetical protein n=1 Tax=Kitasatospora sp. GAS1066B TaxID=3156271 RepID=UPI00351572D8